MKVAILVGSVRNGRQSHKLGYYIHKQLKKRGVTSDLIDLAEMSLPIYGTGDADIHINRAIAIGARLMEAEAIILVTPEYHGSFSGALKNALDYFGDEFKRKAVGIAAASAGRMGGINASTQLQHVVSSMGAYPVPLKLLVPEVYNAFTVALEPTSELITEMTDAFLTEFIWFAEAIVLKKNLVVHEISGNTAIS